jgi:long-chain acyl-CoA synthetase
MATTIAPDETQLRTTVAVWRAALAQGRTSPAYLAETAEGWRPVSWDAAGRRVDELAHGLLARGVRRGDAVGILARTSLEWVLLDWALMSIGAVVVGLYPTSSAKEVAYILDHSEAVLVVVEDEEQRAKVEGRNVLSFAELDALAAEGRAAAAEDPGAVERARDEVAEDDLATLIYTSGTTGPPKGCMLTHRNCAVAATRVDTQLTQPDDVLLLFLPLAHSFGRIVNHSHPFHGYTLALLADPVGAVRAIPEVRPTALPAVPRVFEKIRAGIEAGFAETTGVKRALVDWALRTGAHRDERRIRAAIADRLVFSKVKQRLGGRLRIGLSGGAPLATEHLEFFRTIGLLVVEGYGLTETASSCTVNRPDSYRFGTVGEPVDGCEVRLAEDGELLVRSRTIFTGYYKDEEATRAAFTDDGWFRTGDVGEIDADGFVRITDRKKDLIITAGGKNIAPQNLENALKAHREISQALVVGDRRPYVAALVTLDPDTTRGLTPEDAQRRVQEIVDDVNRDRARVEQIKRFRILDRDFTQDEGELTPTLKLKRRVVQEHYADDIEALYA